jgi:hypothetical protein
MLASAERRWSASKGCCDIREGRRIIEDPTSARASKARDHIEVSGAGLSEEIGFDVTGSAIDDGVG